MTETPAGKAGAFVLMMATGFGLGLGLLCLTALEFDASKPRAPGLSGLKSSLRVRRGLRKRLRYLSGKPGEFFDLIRGRKRSAKGTTNGMEGDAVEGVDFDPGDISVDVNVEGLGAGAAEESVVAAPAPWAGSAPSPGPGGQAASADRRFPSGERADRGDRDPGFRRGAPKVTGLRPIDWSKTRNNSTRGSSGTRAAVGVAAGKAAGERESRRSSLDFVRGGAGAPKGGAAPAPAPASASRGGGGSGGGASTGGGGGGTGAAAPEDMDLPEDYNEGLSPAEQIQQLSMKVVSEKKKAEEEKTKAIALAAAGVHPAAAYHYDRSEKARKKADEYQDQINQITTRLAEQMQGGRFDAGNQEP